MAVVVEEEAHQPGIGFIFRLGFVEVVEGFVHLFDASEGTLHLALGSGCHPPPVRALRHMGSHLYTQVAHHFLEDSAAGNGTVVHVEHLGDALEGKVFDLLGGHGRKQKAQGGFHIFSVNAVVFLIGDPTAVIDNTLRASVEGGPAQGPSRLEL